MSDTPLHRSFDLIRLAFVPAAVGLVMAVLPLRNTDYWWDVAMGNLLARFHAVPIHDPFSFISADADIFIQPWLGTYWLFVLHELTGLAGTLMLRNMAVMVSFGAIALLSYYRNGRNGTATMAWCAGLGIAFGLGVATAGTSTFGWPLFTAAIALSYGIRRGRLPGWTAIGFGAIAALWVNVAPRFFFAAAVPAVVALSALRDDRKVGLWLLAGAGTALLGTLAHPAGFDVWAHVAPPRTSDVGFLLLAASLLDVRVLPFVSDREPVGASLALSVGATTLLLALATAAGPWTVWHGRQLASLHSDARSTPPYAGWMSADVPVDAVEILRVWGSHPRVFVDPRHAGYVAFELGRVGISRHTVFLSPWSDADDRALFEQILDTPEIAPGIFGQRGITAAILDPARHDGLVTSLRHATDWEVALETSETVLFVRRRRPPVDS